MPEITPEEVADVVMSSDFWQEVDPYGVWQDSRGKSLRECIILAVKLSRDEK